jgi:hypothetical protein
MKKKPLLTVVEPGQALQVPAGHPRPKVVEFTVEYIPVPAQDHQERLERIARLLLK